jgi:ABC-type transport system involved in cytochrome c biogenesis ATPase subunit
VHGDRSGNLIGSDEERRTLDQLCEDVRAGCCAAIVVRGEAGIGKTALLRMSRSARPPSSKSPSWRVESEVELVYAGLHQLCAHLTVRQRH